MRKVNNNCFLRFLLMRYDQALNIKNFVALREVRLGVFLNNRNNLCNNNYNLIFRHPHGLRASCEPSTLKNLAALRLCVNL